MNQSRTPRTAAAAITINWDDNIRRHGRYVPYAECARIELDLTAALARAEAAEAGARRYRWLRENKIGHNGLAHHWIPGEPLWDESLDAAIDAALKESGNGS